MGLLESEFDLDDPELVSAIDDLPLWSAPFGLELLERVRMRRGLRALDVGSGLGFPALELAQRLGSTCRVLGVDPWIPAVERAMRKARTWGLANLCIVEARAEDLPFGDRRFDLVVSNNGTNNVDDPERVYREIRRVARPGAQVVLTLNLPGTMGELYGAYRGVLQRRGMTAELEGLEAHVLSKRQPLPELCAMLEEAGFEIAGVGEHAFSLRYADGSAMLQSPFIRLAFSRAWAAVLRPDDVRPVFEEIERELDRQAEAAGELRLSIPWACLELRPAPAGRPR